MDASEMRELLDGYLSEIDWSGGASRDDVVAKLSGRDDALLTIVNEYIPEGTYASAEAVMTLIPAQAWQDAQGDRWRGAPSLLAEDTPSHYQDGPVGQDDSGVYRSGDPAPQTSGFGKSPGDPPASG